MKRILLVTTSYPDQSEGEAAAGVFVRDFARALVAAGVAVEVIAPASENSRREEDNVSTTRFTVPQLPLSLLNPRHIQDWQAIFQTLVQGAKAVSEACALRRPDHILALWALPCGAWALRTAKRFGIPYSTWSLGSDIWTLGKIPLLRQYLSHVLRHAQHRFADGFQLCSDVETICGRHCSFLPSSRNFGPHSSREDKATPPYRLAFLGRWHPNKGVELLLDAMSLLGDMDWGVIETVRLYGGGPLETLVREHAHALQLSGKPVEAGGYLDLEGARHLFEWSDYVLIPSRIESIPVVFSDAMQAGRPVIATPVGDLPQLLQTTGCGILANETTAQSIAHAIQRAIHQDPSGFAEGISRAGETFNVNESARTFLKAISQHG